MPLADPAFEIGAYSVEIAQHDGAHAAAEVQITQCLFDDVLGAAVRVDRLLAMLLVERQIFRRTIGGAGRGEDEVADIGFAERLQEAERARDVHVVEVLRLLEGLADLDQAGEMHRGLRLVFGQHFLQPGLVPDVALFGRAPFDEFGMARGEVIIDDRQIAALGEGEAGVRSDIAGTADDEDGGGGHIACLDRHQERQFFVCGEEDE